MAKIRKIGSIEDAIMQVLKILNEDEVFNSIKKKSDYLRKCSNPDLPQQIDHKDSLKLDLECMKKGKIPPFFTAHEYNVVHQFENFAYKDNDIDELLVKSTILHGKLTEVVKMAEDPKSDDGSKISLIEKKEIMEAIKNLEEKINKIKITIDQK